MLYRVAQEALTNVARHADARQVTLALAHADGTVTLTIDDDGSGIPPLRRRRGARHHRHARARAARPRPPANRAGADARDPRAPGGPGRVTTPVKASVLVADDHAVVRHGVRGILAAQPDFEVIAEAADGAAGGRDGAGAAAPPRHPRRLDAAPHRPAGGGRARPPRARDPRC